MCDEKKECAAHADAIAITGKTLERLVAALNELQLSPFECAVAGAALGGLAAQSGVPREIGREAMSDYIHSTGRTVYVKPRADGGAEYGVVQTMAAEVAGSPEVASLISSALTRMGGTPNRQAGN